MSDRWVCKRCFADNEAGDVSCRQCGLARGSEATPADQATWATARTEAAQPSGRPAWLRYWWVPVLAISLVVGYVVPKAVGIVEGQAIACSFEIGVHNGTLAIFIAVEVLESVTVSVPAAVYSLLMFPLAAIWGAIVSRRVRRPVAA